jgi:hypothetical protein
VRNAFTILTVNHKGKVPLGRLVTDGQNNSTLVLKGSVCVCGCACVGVRVCVRVCLCVYVSVDWILIFLICLLVAL